MNYELITLHFRRRRIGLWPKSATIPLMTQEKGLHEEDGSRRTKKWLAKETALDHADIRVPIAYPSQTVGEVLKAVRTPPPEGWDSADHVFVVNNEKEKKLLGVASIRVLLTSPDEKKVKEVAREDFPKVFPHTKEEHVAMTAIRHDFDVVAVVDHQGRFLGAVDAADLLGILHEYHTERLLKRAGILKDEKVVDIFRARVSTLVRLRLPWLIMGLLGGMVTTFILSRFEGILLETIAVAFFIPVIAYMNDAVGTQTVTLFVRGLTLEEVNLRRYILKEFAVGVLMGAVLGFLIFLYAFGMFGSLRVAETVGISMFLGISVATVNALFFPYFFHRMGKDPAFGSDAMVTIVQDILSILIYLSLATLLVFR